MNTGASVQYLNIALAHLLACGVKFLHGARRPRSNIYHRRECFAAGALRLGHSSDPGALRLERGGLSPPNGVRQQSASRDFGPHHFGPVT